MSGRRILVTGAASGIGAALTRLLRGNGDEVLAIDRVADDSITACDLSDPAAIDAFCESLSDPLDGIAHVAGIPGTHAPDRIVQVNFCAVRHLTAVLASKMARPSCVLAVSSLTAHRCTIDEPVLASLLGADDGAILDLASTMNGADAYAFSKRLLNIWIDRKATEAPVTGLRANAVAPGPIETPILADFKTSMGSDRIDIAAETTGRHGMPDEIAAATAFLLSRQSSWINGVVLDCDGGFNAMRRDAARTAATHDVQGSTK